jgi:hypothetical protein
VGFQWGFFVSCGSQNKSPTRWRSNQVTDVRAANPRWHPTAITCTQDSAAPTWPPFVIFQTKINRCSRQFYASLWLFLLTPPWIVILTMLKAFTVLTMTHSVFGYLLYWHLFVTSAYYYFRLTRSCCSYVLS